MGCVSTKESSQTTQLFVPFEPRATIEESFYFNFLRVSQPELKRGMFELLNNETHRYQNILRLRDDLRLKELVELSECGDSELAELLETYIYQRVVNACKNR